MAVNLFRGAGIVGDPEIRSNIPQVYTELDNGGDRHSAVNEQGQHWVYVATVAPSYFDELGNTPGTVKPRDLYGMEFGQRLEPFSMKAWQFEGIEDISNDILELHADAKRHDTRIQIRRKSGPSVIMRRLHFFSIGDEPKIYSAASEARIQDNAPLTIFPELRLDLKRGADIMTQPNITLRFVPQATRVIRHQGNVLGYRVFAEEHAPS